MRILWAVLFLLVASPASANHEDNRAVFQYGAWSGWANYKAGGFDFCWMSAPYRSGMVMGFALGRTLKWAILFVREQGFPPSAPAQFQLYIDGRHVFTGYAENFGTGLVIPLPDSAALMRAMRAGNALTVVSSYGTSTFSLAGTSRAFVELYGCVKQHSQIAGGGAFGGGSSGGAFGGGGMIQPAPGQRYSASLEDYRVPREDILPVMADIFAENGGRAYKFMPYDANKAIGDVVWQWPDNSLGGIVVYRDSDMPDVTLADEEEKILRDLTSACPSRFVHERRAPPGRDANGFEVRRLFAYCSGEPNSAYFVYSLIQKPGRLYVKLVAARIGTSPPADPFFGDLGYAQDSILRRFSTPQR